VNRIRVDLGPRGYDVVVGEGALSEAPALLGRRARVALVSQAAVAGPWAEILAAPLRQAGATVELFLIDEGEEAKSLATVESLCRRFAAWGLLRGDAVVALGGGVVGDTAGFAAASYHRGVSCLQAPTTLLAQVDAAIGGKTGVNLPEGKNLVGAFHQPAGVVADVSTLATLPEREYRAGLGEVAKYAFLGDPMLAAVLEREAAALAARHPHHLTDVVARCAAIKAQVVAEDEREVTGRRAVLNYGHTLAHALETAGGYDLLHGEAVAVGLVFAAELAAALGRVDDDLTGRSRTMLAGLGLPVRAPEGTRAEDLLAIMRRDKKASGGLTFVLDGPEGVGRVDDPEPKALARAFAAVGIDS
jgi:5-deoxy-5-amino-3-dehydroquinate synthase